MSTGEVMLVKNNIPIGKPLLKPRVYKNVTFSENATPDDYREHDLWPVVNEDLSPPDADQEIAAFSYSVDIPRKVVVRTHHYQPVNLQAHKNKRRGDAYLALQRALEAKLTVNGIYFGSLFTIYEQVNSALLYTESPNVGPSTFLPTEEGIIKVSTPEARKMVYEIMHYLQACNAYFYKLSLQIDNALDSATLLKINPRAGWPDTQLTTR